MVRPPSDILVRTIALIVVGDTEVRCVALSLFVVIAWVIIVISISIVISSSISFVDLYNALVVVGIGLTVKSDKTLTSELCLAARTPNS